MNLLINYIKKYKGALGLALFLATINQVFSLLDPQIFRIITDKYAINASSIPKQDFITGVALLLLASAGVALVSRIAKNFQDYYVSMVTQKVGAELYSHSIEHSFSLPYSAFEDQRSGELLLKLQKARTDSQGLINSFVQIIFLSLVSLTFIVAYAFYVNWLIGIVYILIVPLVGVVQYLLSKKIKAVQRTIVTETASLAGSTTETLRNVELVKSLGLEEQETKRLNQVNNQILGLELRKIKLIRFLSFFQGTFLNTTRVLLLFLLMYLIWVGSITFGEFFSLYIYSFFVFGPLGELGNISNQYQETRASMEKLQTVLNMKPEEKPINPVAVGVVDRVEFKNVDFVYNQSQVASVDNLSLSFEKGQTVAFAGSSGAGKTTVIKLLLGLYKPTKGKILLSGKDSLEVDYEKLRKKVGYVSQDTQLFAGTVRENLLFVSPGADDEKCLSALKQASALSIIERNGGGLDTKIGEGGLKISGGERQRLSIARALLRDPDLIVFDEATSSLDSITEKEITETIKSITKERPNLITIMIAHRLSTIAHADKIFVLEKGKLSEEGNHHDLLSQKGLYYALWRQQDSVLAE
ncbi:MAG: ABC transporter ATP-binding protein [Minisyncoccia bacterium]